MKKNLISSDYHGTFIDRRAFDILLKFTDYYKPDQFIINGDFLDFYSISKFDKNVNRKYDVQDEINIGKWILRQIRETVGNKTKIVYLKGNHEERLSKFLWANPEIAQLDALELKNLLALKDFGVQFIDVTCDYWKSDSGHYQIADMLIMHGDNRLNGASTSKYSGYSAKNTMMTLQNSVAIGHCHRLGLIYNSSPYKELIGLECGCLCLPTGTANWQQGFVTFENDKETTFNHRLHFIKNGSLIIDGKKYISRKKNIKL